MSNGICMSAIILCCRWLSALNGAIEECREKGLKCGKELMYLHKVGKGSLGHLTE